MMLPAVLLKRSDAPYYRVHFGNDFEAMAETLAVHQAFEVVPILILPRASPDAAGFVEEAIQTHCLPLRNTWFAAASPEIAAGILLRALRVKEETPLFSTTPQASQTTPEATQSGAEKETISAETTDALLSKHLVPCAPTQDADTAAEIRKELTQRLGKTMAKQIIRSCVSTTATTSTGNKNRVLKANGKLLKLKTQS
ncbi:MAG: hypothetical protein ACFHHU_01370 [Porticoccaceae bacterium]